MKCLNVLRYALLIVLAFSAAGRGDWVFVPSATVRETYDDNVFMQDRGNLANRASMVSTIAPSLVWSNQFKENASATLGYVPEFNFFHSEHSEDFVNHALSGGLKLSDGQWALDASAGVNLVDGNHFGPTYLAPGGVPAMGGIVVRDRRDAAIYKSQICITYTPGDWLIRPRLTGYVHDFQAHQSTDTGYENYVDRSDISGGLDVGHKVQAEQYVYVGYRYGWQHQSELFNNPLAYSNHYQRILIGAEGKLASIAKFAIAVGPDFRSFYGEQMDGFDTTHVKLFIDASATISLSADDDLTFIIKRYMQPSFCGKAIYEDSTYQMGYKHKFSQQLSAETFVRTHAGDWGMTSNRDDDIYTFGLSAAYKLNDHLSIDAGYTFDTAESNVPNTPGREFHRNQVFVGGRLVF